MERCHGVVRHKLGAKTTIRLRKRRRAGERRRGECRQEMEEAFDSEAYGQRWQIESAFSRCKRRLGSSLKARNVWAQRQEIQLRVLTHNLMILLPHNDLLHWAKRTHLVRRCGKATSSEKRPRNDTGKMAMAGTSARRLPTGL